MARLARSLAALRSELDTRYPRRSKASDGWIADKAHSLRVSDHNAGADGIVRALDVTHDPAGGFHAHFWARVTAARGDERVKYLISEGEIWNPSSSAWATYRALRAEGATRRAAARAALPGWRKYSGPNPHRAHVHVSIKPTAAAESDTSSWFDEDLVLEDPVLRPAAVPPPAPTNRITIHPTMEVEGMRIDTIPISWERLDDDGRGWVDVAAPQERIVGILPQGSDPVKEGYWPPLAWAVNGLGEITRITLTGEPRRGGMVYVKVLIAEDS